MGSPHVCKVLIALEELTCLPVSKLLANFRSTMARLPGLVKLRLRVSKLWFAAFRSTGLPLPGFVELLLRGLPHEGPFGAAKTLAKGKNTYTSCSVLKLRKYQCFCWALCRKNSVNTVVFATRCKKTSQIPWCLVSETPNTLVFMVFFCSRRLVKTGKHNPFDDFWFLNE